MAASSRLPGVTFLDHTADVGLEARAPDREELFRRAARGTLALVEGEEQEGEERDDGGAGGSTGSRALTLEADDLPGLLRGWLRELLWWHEVEGLAFRGAGFETLEEDRLEATVELGPAGRALREIKGVTLHGLRAEREGDEWRARVIFDV